MSENWTGQTFEADLGRPGHGGFVVARHEGRVIFVRHGLPGERARVRITEDRGGSFARGDAVEIIAPSAQRIDRLCPVSGPGGAGCCDFSHATLALTRELKSEVVAEQLHRIAGVDQYVEVEELAESAGGSGWRTRVRLAVDEQGRPGYHTHRSHGIVTDLRCPQISVNAYSGLASSSWRPGSELQIALDGTGERHVVEIAPPKVSRTGKSSSGRRGASARRAAGSAPRRHRVVEGSGRAIEIVDGRRWEIAATGFWQAHRSAAHTYSGVVREWAQLSAGQRVWDLYGGAGVFAAAVAGEVGPSGVVDSVDFSVEAVRDGSDALADLPQVRLRAARVERVTDALVPSPDVVVLDPPRAGAGKDVVAAVAAADPSRIVHVGCDPAAFARDISLYAGHGYRLEQLRAFDAFPLTHHVECLALLVRSGGASR